MEADYRVTIELPNDMRDERAKAKKTPEGWSKMTYLGFWEPVDKLATVIEKKSVRSSIAQVPSAGYVKRDNFSKSSIQWPEYEMELAKRKGDTLCIKHELNGGNNGHQVQSRRVVRQQHRVCISR